MTNTLVWNTNKQNIVVADGLNRLKGNLTIPKGAQGLVLFALSDNNTCSSVSNRLMAHILNRLGFATLLSDLLTHDEEANDLRSRHQLHFDVELLAERLVNIVVWLAQYPDTCHLKTGCFGIGTGAGAALVAATKCSGAIAAIVCQSGRVDLAGTAITQVQVPTLLIVGDADLPTLCMNQDALISLPQEKRLELIADATHEFKEPGALERAIQLASQWFKRYLIPIY